MSEQTKPIPCFRYTKEHPSSEQVERARRTDMYREGDMVLIWVNEGDLYRIAYSGIRLDEERIP